MSLRVSLAVFAALVLFAAAGAAVALLATGDEDHTTTVTRVATVTQTAPP